MPTDHRTTILDHLADLNRSHDPARMTETRSPDGSRYSRRSSRRDPTEADFEAAQDAEAETFYRQRYGD